MYKILAAALDIPSTGYGDGLTRDSIVNTVINTLIWFIGIIAVCFIIVGGIKYATSGGDEKKVASAKNTILYAVIGLVVALLAAVRVSVRYLGRPLFGSPLFPGRSVLVRFSRRRFWRASFNTPRSPASAYAKDRVEKGKNKIKIRPEPKAKNLKSRPEHPNNPRLCRKRYIVRHKE